MKCFSYISIFDKNKPIMDIHADNITDADTIYEEIKGKHPSKIMSIGVIIKPSKFTNNYKVVIKYEST